MSATNTANTDTVSRENYPFNQPKVKNRWEYISFDTSWTDSLMRIEENNSAFVKTMKKVASSTLLPLIFVATFEILVKLSATILFNAALFVANSLHAKIYGSTAEKTDKVASSATPLGQKSERSTRPNTARLSSLAVAPKNEQSTNTADRSPPSDNLSTEDRATTVMQVSSTSPKKETPVVDSSPPQEGGNGQMTARGPQIVHNYTNAASQTAQPHADQSTQTDQATLQASEEPTSTHSPKAEPADQTDRTQPHKRGWFGWFGLGKPADPSNETQEPGEEKGSFVSETSTPQSSQEDRSPDLQNLNEVD